MHAVSKIKRAKAEDYMHPFAMLQFLDHNGFDILDDHKNILFHDEYSITDLDGLAKVEDVFQDKLSSSVFGDEHNKDVDILSIIAAYANRRGLWGRTPLHVSVGKGNTRLVGIFLAAGADVDAEDEDKETPLHLSAWTGYKYIVDILLKAGANVDAEDKYKQTPLRMSALLGNKDIVDILLISGANVDAEDEDNETPLHVSAREGHKEIVKNLLEAGANVDAEDKDKQTPLHKSALAGHKDIVDILFKAGANVDAEDKDKATPLHKSALKGHKDIVEILLAAGANVDAEDILKQTPLHYSVQNNHDDIAERLLRAGASVKKRNIYNKSVLDYMNNRQKVRFFGKPGSKSFSLRNWIYSVTNKNKSVSRSRSTEIEIERSETVGTTFIDSDSWTIIYDRSCNNGQDDISKDSSTLLASGTSHSSSAVIASNPGPLRATSISAERSSSSGSLFDPPTSAESHDLDYNERQDLNNLRQEFKDYVAKFSPEHIESWGTISSSAVKAAFLAGRVVMPTTMYCTKNITNIKKIKKTYNYGPGTNLDIKYAEAVAPYGKVVVHKIRNATDDEDDDGSSSGDDSNKTIKGIQTRMVDVAGDQGEQLYYL